MKNDKLIQVPHIKRNPGTLYSEDIFAKIRINRSAVERRIVTLVKRRSIKKEWQAAWLLKAISCIDLTTLSGDDTWTNIKRICDKALHPVRQDLLDRMEFTLPLRVAAVCVYHNFIAQATDYLASSTIPVAAVSTGFPAGQISHATKIKQIQESVAAGAQEIDIVISRSKVLAADWKSLYDEIVAYRQACGDAHLKTILATGELPNLNSVAKASQVCMMAGADFIKTSTGKERINATLPVSLVMTRQIRDYYQRTGFQIGFKPAGGIRKAKQALQWLILIKEELGIEWMQPRLFRFGASGLLSDIERQLEHYVTGRYSATYRHPMA